MFARTRIYLLIAVLLGSSAFAQLDTPARQAGPTGYSVTDIEYVPGSTGSGSAGMAFVAVGSHLFRSTDGGATLEATGFVSSDDIRDLTIAASGTLYVASGPRVFISADGGVSFTLTVPFAASGVVLERVEVHPTNPLDVWVGYRQGFSSGGILRTTDGGQTWSNASPPGWSGTCAAITFDPQTPSRILLVRYSYYAFLSDDGGSTWVQTSYTSAGDGCLDAAFVGSNIVLSTFSRVVVTTDYGAAWSTISAANSIPQTFSIPGAARIRSDPSTPGRAVLATQVGGLFESLDSGVTWSPLNAPSIHAEALALNLGAVTLIGTPFGLLHRTATGQYERSTLPASAASLALPLDVMDLSVAPDQATRMGALLRPGSTSNPHLQNSALATTDDGGATWTLDATAPPRLTSVDHGPSGSLYVTGSQRLTNGDGAASIQRLTPSGWAPIGPASVPGDTVWGWDIEVDPANPLRLFALTSSQINSFQQELVVWRSVDGGSSWQVAQTATNEFISARPQITIFGSTAAGALRIAYIQRLPSNAFYGGEVLMVSDDGGSTWAGRSGASYFDNETINVSGGGANPGRLYVAKTSPGYPEPLHVSDDGGLSWNPIGAPLTKQETVTASANEQDTLYLTGDDGLVRATYSGASTEALESITGSVAGTRVAQIAGGTLVAAFGSSGIWLKTVPATSGTSYCGPSVANSTGASAELRMVGTSSIAADALTLVARRLPAGTTSLAIVGDAQGFAAQPGGSFGNLCLGGGIGRFAPQVGSSDPCGTYRLALDLGALPRPGGTASAIPGQTLQFQTWFRDALGGTVASNFTDAVAVTFTN